MYEGNSPDQKENPRNSKDTALPSSKFLLKCHLCRGAPAPVRPACRDTHPQTLPVTLHFSLFHPLIVSYTWRQKLLGKAVCTVPAFVGDWQRACGCYCIISTDQRSSAPAEGVLRHNPTLTECGSERRCERAELQSGINQTGKAFTANQKACLSNTLPYENDGKEILQHKGKIFCSDEISRSFKGELAFSSQGENRTGNCKWHQWFGLYD